MTDRKTQIANWQATLEKTFDGVRGDVGTLVQAMYAQEAHHARLAKHNCTGFTTLLQSFFDFALRTMIEIRHHTTVLNVHNIAYNMAALRCARVGWRDWECGYYFDGIRPLRAVFENTMYLGAVLRGLFWFDELHSFARNVDLKTIEPDMLQKLQHSHVTNVAQRVTRSMYGQDSALTTEEQVQVRRFIAMQHMHVHRGDSNVAHFIVDMVQNHKMPEVAPEFDMKQASIFANTAACAAWTLHRTLQYSSEPAKNSASWHEQWAVLDNAFRFWVDGWEATFARPMLKLIDTSFTFDAITAVSQLRKTQQGGRDSVGNQHAPIDGSLGQNHE